MTRSSRAKLPRSYRAEIEGPETAPSCQLHYLYKTNINPMDIATTKLELMQRLMAIMDEGTLQRVASFFKKEVPVEEDLDDDITDEEYAQFQEELARRDRGEIRFHTREEFVAELNKAIAEGGE